MHPIERRRPRVSVQDLRRDLREADEDRYRLLIRTGDWRHPRVGVQEIRRQLREADEDRFVLTMRVRSLMRVIKRGGIGVCLILIAGGAFAFRAVRQPDTPLPDTRTEAALDATAPDAGSATELIDLPVPPAPRTPPATRPARTSPRRPVAPNRGRAVPARKPETVRVVPRPLHPGEFGRRL